MRKLLALVVAAWIAFACGDGGKVFGEAEILTFAIEGETVPSRIDADARHVEVTVAAADELAQAVISAITVSARASASVQVGDEIDLSGAVHVIVTAEDGTESDWEIVGTVGSGDDGGAGGELNCDSQLITYQLTGDFEITDTPLGAGDAIKEVGPGELTLRVTRDGTGPRLVSVVSYQLTEKFIVDSTGATVRTDNETSAGPEACGLASGQLEDGVVSWDSCDYGPEPPFGTNDWTSEDVVGGPGCLNDYHVEGVVSCTGGLCGFSGVDFPVVLDETYPQPLNSFEMSEDLSTFVMKGLGAPTANEGRSGVELPNGQPGRSWLSLTGTRTAAVCEEPPTCP